jgi:hypothetical protein
MIPAQASVGRGASRNFRPAAITSKSPELCSQLPKHKDRLFQAALVLN